MPIQSKRNENRLIYDTRWRHLNSKKYLHFRGKTPFNQIIQKLEKETKQTYAYKHISAFKQFLYNKKLPSGEPKWKKTCMDWTIEYKIDNKWV